MQPYPDYMLESIEMLESTRESRLKQKFPTLSHEQKLSLLEQYHPDYKPGTKRKLRVGPNAGDYAVNEIADMLEAYSILDPAKIDLSKPDLDADVLVIGGGGAGASAALTAQENGAQVLLATKLRLGDANTMMAQAGIQSSDVPGDSPEIHYLDVMAGGGYTNIPELVAALVLDAPLVIQWLEDLGMMFDKQEDGSMITAFGGGASRPRVHSAKDYTGGEIMKVLRDELRSREDIEILEFSPALELLTDNGRCTGAVLFNLETREYLVCRAKTTILATGGCGRLHVQGFPTTNHYGATGDGLVIGYRAGAKLIYVDTIQYHPTGAAYPEQILGYLVTEKLRGVGAQLVNRNGERFFNELETRDAVASAIIRECWLGNGIATPGGYSGVWLDTPLVEMLHGEGYLRRMFPAMYRQYARFGIDISKYPILVYPTQHYQNGGILIDPQARTSVDCLYAAGEVEGGVHGRNRLVGNSLLDILVFGRRAGRAAALKASQIGYGKLSLDHVIRYHGELERAGIPRMRFSPLILPDYRTQELKQKMKSILLEIS